MAPQLLANMTFCRVGQGCSSVHDAVCSYFCEVYEYYRMALDGLYGVNIVIYNVMQERVRWVGLTYKRQVGAN